MTYKKRGNRRRSKAAWRSDYKYHNKSQKWESKKKHKRHHRRARSGGGIPSAMSYIGNV